MSVSVTTKEFIGLLQALVHTAAGDPDQGAMAGILLHTARGYATLEPGQSGLLVGTSTNTAVVGHTWVLASGQMQPMLWPIGEVPAAVAVLRQMSTGQPEHQVEISSDGKTVTLSEGEDLFGEGAKYTFELGDAGKFPASIWRLISDVHLRPAVIDHETGKVVPEGVRTRIAARNLAPFVAVGKARKEVVEWYRYHPRLPVLVVIGHNYRGALLPERADDDLQAVDAPAMEVYPADLPKPKPDKPDAAITSTVDLRHATGVLAGAATDDPEESQ